MTLRCRPGDGTFPPPFIANKRSAFGQSGSSCRAPAAAVSYSHRKNPAERSTYRAARRRRDFRSLGCGGYVRDIVPCRSCGGPAAIPRVRRSANVHGCIRSTTAQRRRGGSSPRHHPDVSLRLAGSIRSRNADHPWAGSDHQLLPRGTARARSDSYRGRRDRATQGTYARRSSDLRSASRAGDDEELSRHHRSSRPTEEFVTEAMTELRAPKVAVFESIGTALSMELVGLDYLRSTTAEKVSPTWMRIKELRSREPPKAVLDNAAPLAAVMIEGDFWRIADQLG